MTNYVYMRVCQVLQACDNMDKMTGQIETGYQINCYVFYMEFNQQWINY